ncbi:MAG TPA: LytTR family DNA-binding domain-containing protein [Chitinophagaceae bacterium]|nr:LytTR family DNA-binding domain-containing protein [Chitinophagaceae bacterium]
MIRTIIIDDEQNCVESLAFDIGKHCPEIEIIETCTSSKDGLLSIRRHRPDLVFLDVQMPWMNGFEMLEMLDVIDFAIIFTTAYDQFAARAFRLSVVDYLLKPVDINDLQDAVRKASLSINQKKGTANISNLLHNINRPEQKQRIAFFNKDGYEFVEMSQVVFVQAEGAYSHLYLTGKRKLVISKTLSDIEEMLPAAYFHRIHHSTVINLDHVTHFLRADGGYVIMDSGEKLAVSKSRKEQVMERLGLK